MKICNWYNIFVVIVIVGQFSVIALNPVVFPLSPPAKDSNTLLNDGKTLTANIIKDLNNLQSIIQKINLPPPAKSPSPPAPPKLHYPILFPM